MKKLSRRKALRFFGAAAAGAGTLFARGGIAAPVIGKGTVLTVSTWGGVTQDAITAHAAPEFTRATGATLAFDIGAQGPRQTMLGFRTEEEAEAWIVTDKARGTD